MSTLSIIVWMFYRIDEAGHARNLAAGQEAAARAAAAVEGGLEPPIGRPV